MIITQRIHTLLEIFSKMLSITVADCLICLVALSGTCFVLCGVM